MTDRSPAEVSLQRRRASHISWMNTRDPAARTAPGRAAADARFEHQVDPEGVLPEAERRRRAEHAKKAYFAALAVRSAEVRRRRKRAS